MALWIPICLVIAYFLLIMVIVMYGALYPSVVEQRFRVRATFIFGMILAGLSLLFFSLSIVGILFFS